MFCVARGPRRELSRALLTHSCTAALEMAAHPDGLGAGRRGDHAVVHVRLDGQRRSRCAARRPSSSTSAPDTLNLDESLHRGGHHAAHARRSCPSTTPASAATWTRSWPIADRARAAWSSRTPRKALLASYRRPAARWHRRHCGALSFHETKNVICGEGGALLVNDPALIERAEILREKGTEPEPASSAARWTSTPGSTSAPLICPARSSPRSCGRDGEADAITARRMDIWQAYHDASSKLEAEARSRPVVPERLSSTTPTCTSAVAGASRRGAVIERVSSPTRHSGRCSTTCPCTPRHSADAAGRYVGAMRNTVEVNERLLRLPLWLGLEDQQDLVIAEVIEAVQAN